METIKLYIFVIASLVLSGVHGQNLVLNGDFEDCTCPEAEFYTSLKSCKNVMALNNTTPDYFNSCIASFYNPINNPWGTQQPKSGNGYIGFLLYMESSHPLEYFKLDLVQKLEPGEYLLSFYLSWAECSDLSLDKFSFLFTDDYRKLKWKKGLIANKSHIITLPDSLLADRSAWVKIEVVYKAKGGESQLVFGTFKDCLKKLKVKQKEGEFNCFIDTNMAYYFMDDITLIPLDEVKTERGQNYSHH